MRVATKHIASKHITLTDSFCDPGGVFVGPGGGFGGLDGALVG